MTSGCIGGVIVAMKWGQAAEVLVVLAACVIACKSGSQSKNDDSPKRERREEATPAATANSEAETIRAWQSAPTLTAAIAASKPMMADTVNDIDGGSAQLWAWALGRMTWPDVAVKDETSIAKVKKDPDAERGKRMCAPGSIVEISASDTPAGKGYEGLLLTSAMNLVRFLAVKSTGELVQNSSARFCGVVTGKFDYANSAGGVGHAVKMVGMFDLPENRK